MARVTVRCTCGAEATVNEQSLGRTIACSGCGGTFVAERAEARTHAGPAPTAQGAALTAPVAPSGSFAPATGPPAASADASSEPSAIVPERVPAVLRLPEARLPILCGLLGIAAGLVVSVLMYNLTSRESMEGRIFDLREPSSAIPVAIMCMFFWAMAVCAVRWLRIRALEKLSEASVLTQSVTLLNQGGIRPLLAKLEQPNCQASPMHRRLHAVLRQWLLRPSLQDADVVLQQHATNDEETVFAGYNMVRTFIWAMPVLGLIGTVLGIALAVAAFSSFLGGSVDDVEVIKKSLVEVTSGLSFAFLITLEGLLGALLAMVPSAALQAREARLYADVQHGIVDVFLPAVQRVASEAAFLKAVTGSSAARATTEATSAFDQALERALTRHWPDMEAWQTAMQTTALALNCSIAETGDLLRRQVSELGARVAETLGSAGQRAAEDMKQVVSEFTAANRQVNDALLRTYGEIVSQEHQQARQLSQELATGAAGYLDGLQQVERQLGEDLGQHSLQLGAYVQALRDLTDRADGLARLPATVHGRLEGMEQGGGLPDSLARLQEVIDRLTPALEKLVRPKVLRLVDIDDTDGHWRSGN